MVVRRIRGRAGSVSRDVAEQGKRHREQISMRLELFQRLTPVSGDRIQLLQIILKLLNLVRNSFEAMSQEEES